MFKILTTAFKCIYYVFPKFVRQQYIDSMIFYRGCFLRVVNALNYAGIKPEKKSLSVKLVYDFDLLGTKFDLLKHVTERYANVRAPLLYVDNKECNRLSLEGRLPDTKVVRLSEVHVIGSTDAIISGSNMYHQELSLMEKKHDLKQPDIFSKNNIDVDVDFDISILNNEVNLSGSVVSLLKEHSTNYYHWLTEVVPKLVNILECLEFKNERITILIEAGVPKQSIDIIELLLSECKYIEYELFHVKKGQFVYCESLIYCTPLWTSLDNTRYLPNPKKEFFVSVDCLKEVKLKLSKCMESKKKNSISKKIYLQRENSKLRKLNNVLELEKLLYKKGFDFVDPGSLDFGEQYSLFSQADIIVGASGAAFTNLIFMKPGSKAISLYPSAQSTNYYVFQPLADVSNVEFIHFLTTPDDDSNSVHGDAKVNVEELEKLLEKIDD